MKLTKEDTYTFTWTGGNITDTKKYLKRLSVACNFVDKHLYVDRLGGFVEPNSKIIVIPGLGAIGSELNK